MTKSKLLVLNHSILFLGVSIYFGTGWSTAIFEFPVVPQLNVDNYYLHFIPQIAAATDFFTFLVSLMLATGVVMVIAEWKTRFRWVPIAVLLLICAATSLTMFVIFPVNEILEKGITDPNQLSQVLDKWVSLTKIRVGLWSLEWLCMMYYFAAKALPAGATDEG
jgi:hypothetical protein